MLLYGFRKLQAFATILYCRTTMASPELPTSSIENGLCEWCSELVNTNRKGSSRPRVRVFGEIEDTASLGCALCLPIHEGLSHVDKLLYLVRRTRISITIDTTDRGQVVKFWPAAFRNGGVSTSNRIRKVNILPIADGSSRSHHLAPETRDPSVNGASPLVAGELHKTP
ncbi:hypothetical protein BDV96DRAFT_26015 [Lophiotrema nucula]|uniref:Uncharacterized protein n=1 Tax=Lophiotrema nucula TaxID=690887 RepID=A0A6A5ZFB8_9PLEO|nr:hypothetical protein BDV96DRAFT_26015 [Lophiotrema nucula]